MSGQSRFSGSDHLRYYNGNDTEDDNDNDNDNANQNDNENENDNLFRRPSVERTTPGLLSRTLCL